jgi:hypothetical protein
VAPSKIVTDPVQDAAPTGDAGPPDDAGPARDGPTDAPAGKEQPYGTPGKNAGDAPPNGPPEGQPDGAFQDAEIAATNAFDQILAEGGTLEEAMNAGMKAAAESGLNAVPEDNPEHFGSRESGLAVMNRTAEEAFLGVTGRMDPSSAGTGAGAGDFSEHMFFQNAIDSVVQNEIAGLEGGLFGDFSDGPLFGGEGAFFDQFFDDPFREFAGDAFFDPFM